MLCAREPPSFSPPNRTPDIICWNGRTIARTNPTPEPHERGLSKTCELSATPSTQVGAAFKRAWQTTYDSQPANGTLSAQIKDGETLQSGDIAPEGTIVTFTAQPDPGFYLFGMGRPLRDARPCPTARARTSANLRIDPERGNNSRRNI